MGILTVLKNRNKVLGLNSRYLEYMRPYNKRRGIRIADNKIRTKKILLKAGLPVPKLLKVISSFDEIESLSEADLPNSFVMKPVHGLEGGGIEIYFNKVGSKWIRADRSRSSLEELKSAMRDIVEGNYSIYNRSDQVMLEERVKPHPNFKQYTYKGTPDLRVIVFEGIPVMAMLRIPTKKSKGRANLSLGAMGAAIDLSAGRVTTAIIGKGGKVEHVPHNGLRLSGLKIPDWNKILEYSVGAQSATGLGYASVDFLIDRDFGPLIVEVNGRTGLSIQLADEDGLRGRLERVKGTKLKSVQHGIRVGKDLFGGEIQENVANITGKAVIGRQERAVIQGVNGKAIHIIAKIDTGAYRSSIDTELAYELGYENQLRRFDEVLEEFEDEISNIKYTREERITIRKEMETYLEEEFGIEKIASVASSHGTSYRPVIKIDIEIGGEKYTITATVFDRSGLRNQVILGRKSLSKRFLIDPSKAL